MEGVTRPHLCFFGGWGPSLWALKFVSTPGSGRAGPSNPGLVPPATTAHTLCLGLFTPDPESRYGGGWGVLVLRSSCRTLDHPCPTREGVHRVDGLMKK